MESRMSRVELFSRRVCAARLPPVIVALSLVSLAAIGWKSGAGALVLWTAGGLAAEAPKSAPDDKVPAAAGQAGRRRDCG